MVGYAIIWLLKVLGIPVVTSCIFYAIVVYYPRHKRSKNALEIFNKLYIDTKKHILQDILGFLKKRGPKDIDNIVLDYAECRKLIDENSSDFIRNNTSGPKFLQLNKGIHYELETLKTMLLHLLEFEFIKDDIDAYKRIIYLKNSIDNFYYSFSTFYREDDDLEYSKYFNHYMFRFIFGFDAAYGEIEKDDFPRVIARALSKKAWHVKAGIWFQKVKALEWIKKMGSNKKVD